MLGTIKQFVPYLFYVFGMVVVVLSLTGRVNLALVFILPLLPLRNVIEKLQGLPLGNDFLDILFFSMIIGWIVSAMSKNDKIMQPSPLNLICFISIVYTFFSFWIGYNTIGYVAHFILSDPRLHFWKNYTLLPVIYFLTLNNIKDRKWMFRVIAVMCLTMMLMNYYTVRQITWFSELVSRRKITGTFVYLGPNEVAAFYNQYTMILMALFFAVKNKMQKIFLFGLSLINVFCVIFLYSRAAYLGFAVGCLFLFSIKKKILLIPLICAALAWQFVLPEKVIERIEMTTTESGELEASAGGRIEIWKQSIELWQESPIFGIGLNVFKHMGYGLGDTHNIYLKILSEQGIVGLIIFLIIILAFLRIGIRLSLYGEDDIARSYGVGFTACILVLLVNNIFGERWTHMQLSAYLWVFAGIAQRLNINSQQNRNSSKEKATGNEKKRVKTNIRRGLDHGLGGGFSR